MYIRLYWKGFFFKTCDMYNVVKRKCLNSEMETTHIFYKNFTTHITSYWITTYNLIFIGLLKLSNIYTTQVC